MWRQRISTPAAFAFYAVLTVGSAAALTPPTPDNAGVRDTFTTCTAAPQDRSQLQPTLERGVFSVWVEHRGTMEPKGTATLVDKSGIFVTAAHVVHSDADKKPQIEIRQNTDGPITSSSLKYSVRPLSDTKDWHKSDLALLQAEGWDHPPLTPVPFRFDELWHVDGFFIGHREGMDQTVFERFTEAYGDKAATGGMRFSGRAFPHASGALMLDGGGRAFGMVLSHKDFSDTQLITLSIEGLFSILYGRETFSGFPFANALERIKVIPPSLEAKHLLNVLATKGISNNFLWGLEQGPKTGLTQIDMLHLIDATVSHPGLKELSDRMWTSVQTRLTASAQRLCTSGYFWQKTRVAMQPAGAADTQNTHRATPLDAIPIGATPVAPPAGQPAPPPPGSGNLDSQSLRSPADAQDTRRGAVQTDTVPVGAAPGAPGESTPTSPPPGAGNLMDVIHLDDALRLGTKLLQHALLESAGASEPDQRATAAEYARRALRVLRAAADDGQVRRALSIGRPKRSYAALLANLALAEDLGTAHGFGEREAARDAILAANALGGSPTAYHLAARYALDEGDAVAAAGLYQRAYAMLSDATPGSKALRTGLAQDFTALASANAVLANATIADSSPIQVASLPAASRWHGLAANTPNDFTFKGTLVARRSGDRPITNIAGLPIPGLGGMASLHTTDVLAQGAAYPPKDAAGAAGPLLVGDVMYVHAPATNSVYALDLKNQSKLLWKYEPKRNPNADPAACCGTATVGGPVFADGKLFLHLPDTTLLALDVNTGKVVWSVKSGEPAKGEVGVSWPLILPGKVAVGSSGGAFGSSGGVTLYDVKDGRLIWREAAKPASTFFGMPIDVFDMPAMTQADAPDAKTFVLDAWQGNHWELSKAGNWRPDAHSITKFNYPPGMSPPAATHN